jgi:hypothetical protein
MPYLLFNLLNEDDGFLNYLRVTKTPFFFFAIKQFIFGVIEKKQ